MPNHVTNILVVSGDADQKQAMFEAIKSDEHGLGRSTSTRSSPYRNPSKSSVAAEQTEQ